jgi:tRNA A37 threonylcarbamoyladenosine modification protein TsaB
VDALFTLYTACGEREKARCALIDARNGNAYAALYSGRANAEQLLRSVEDGGVLSHNCQRTLCSLATRREPKAYPRAKKPGRRRSV